MKEFRKTKEGLFILDKNYTDFNKLF